MTDTEDYKDDMDVMNDSRRRWVYSVETAEMLSKLPGRLN